MWTKITEREQKMLKRAGKYKRGIETFKNSELIN